MRGGSFTARAVRQFKSARPDQFFLPPDSSWHGPFCFAAERLMQEHKVRRIPIVDADGQVIGIVSQADLAMKDKPEKVAMTVAEVSKPPSSTPVAA
jgi:signal-transduction protein with cAMP-binding, CBS, and nucleotidyltransferase domain